VDWRDEGGVEQIKKKLGRLGEKEKGRNKERKRN
jgi:hypothetical protein